jgi:uncharacterized protein YecE (DUF72 family)
MDPPTDPQGRLFSGADASVVTPVEPASEWLELSARLRERWGGRLHLGTSSWHFPGWYGLVWARPHAEAVLSRHGLRAYAAHPLLRCVSLDRAFYRALDATTYGQLAAQVPPAFRFVVKAPAALSDALLREAGSGKALAENPQFLDPRDALESCVQPALAGLGERLGALVLQVSPLPDRWLRDSAALHTRLEPCLRAMRDALPATTLVALEVRNPDLLTPELAALLQASGARYCLGIHARMPSAAQQLPMLRATWPGDLVLRWNLQAGQRYAQARDRWAPFDRLQAPDPATRHVIARVACATLDAGHRAFITINNKAEGSAPHSVLALARALLDGASP